MVQSNIDAGIGTTATYTGSGDSSLLGDLDGDGAVTSADLLLFLSNFGQRDLMVYRCLSLQSFQSEGLLT